MHTIARLGDAAAMNTIYTQGIREVDFVSLFIEFPLDFSVSIHNYVSYTLVLPRHSGTELTKPGDYGLPQSALGIKAVELDFHMVTCLGGGE